MRHQRHQDLRARRTVQLQARAVSRDARELGARGLPSLQDRRLLLYICHLRRVAERSGRLPLAKHLWSLRGKDAGGKDHQRQAQHDSSGRTHRDADRRVVDHHAGGRRLSGALPQPATSEVDAELASRGEQRRAVHHDHETLDRHLRQARGPAHQRQLPQLPSRDAMAMEPQSRRCRLVTLRATRLAATEDVGTRRATDTGA